MTDPSFIKLQNKLDQCSTMISLAMRIGRGQELTPREKMKVIVTAALKNGDIEKANRPTKVSDALQLLWHPSLEQTGQIRQDIDQLYSFYLANYDFDQ